MRLDGERERRGLDVPASRDAAQLARERVAIAGGDVLDDARAVREVELPVLERQAAHDVRQDERPRVVGPGLKVDARDVERRLMAAQPEPSTSDVDDPAVRPGTGQCEQSLVAARARAPRGDRRRPGAKAGLRGGVDVLGSPAGHPATLPVPGRPVSRASDGDLTPHRGVKSPSERDGARTRYARRRR